jgi:hypothetical protein
MTCCLTVYWVVDFLLLPPTFTICWVDFLSLIILSPPLYIQPLVSAPLADMSYWP